MEKKHQLNFGYFLLALWGVLLFQTYFGPASRQADISYSQFEEYLESGRISRIAIDEQYIRGEFNQPVEGKTTFITPRLDPQLADKLAGYDVEFTAVITDPFLSNLISWVAPAAIFIGMWLFVFRKFAEKQGMGGMMNIGKTSTRVLVEKNTDVTFDDVAGVDEAKEELLEVVNFLQEPERYSRLGAHIPKGVLLVGPPGTGKTLLARAVAGQAGVPFYSISGSEFIEMFVGVGAARVRDLFNQAKEHAPAIIFIDELDALGRARGLANLSGGHDEREQTLNQLLAEMDGFSPSSGVIILAATNRPEILDPALLRAGRFDRQVLVDKPDKYGRIQILTVHAKKIIKDASVDLTAIASLTTGFSGADLANLVNEAALLATRRNASMVSIDDFTQAIERIIAGLEKKNRLINEHEKSVVAHHEAGHALVGMSLNPEQPIHKISIIPRGVGTLGYTIQRPTEDRFLISTRELSDKLAVLLAGRAAEKLIFNEVTTGAADDLAKATDIAHAMVTRYGMSEEVGLMALEEKQSLYLEGEQIQPQNNYGEDVAQQVSVAVRRLLDNSFTVAENLLKVNEPLLRELAAQLIREETLSETMLETFRKRLQLPVTGT
jgi:cell division protease FtsH